MHACIFAAGGGTTPRPATHGMNSTLSGLQDAGSHGKECKTTFLLSHIFRRASLQLSNSLAVSGIIFFSFDSIYVSNHVV